MKLSKMLGSMVATSALIISSMAFAAEVTDATIVKDIETKFSSDPITSSLNLNVKSNAGIVTLSGNVKTDQEASRAIELAESTPGVTDTNVTNLMVEKSNQPFADTIITAKVKGTFMREKLFGDDISVMGINVETTNGTVVLTGEVDSQIKAENAIKLAKSIDGVKDVQSKLVIKPSAS